MSTRPKQVDRRRWLRALRKKVGHLLLSEWDPIGVFPGGPRDEYDAYAARVCSLLAQGASQTEVANYLYSAAREQMGLESPPVEGLARKLVQLLDP